MGNNGFLNLGDGLHLIFHDPSINKMDLLTELFVTANGRLNRKSFIYRCLFLSLVFGILNVILQIVGVITFVIPMYVIQFIFSAINAVCTLTLSIRRLHDVGRCGLWVLFAFIPLLNLIFFLYLICKRGDTGPNDYGPDPLQ